MKKYLIILVLATTLIIGCGNNTYNKAIEEGKFAVANQEYEKSQAMFELAIKEKNNDKEANA